MKQLYILPILLLLFAACNRDDSTGIIRSVSEITIEDETEELNVDFGFELIRKANVTQTMPDVPLTYEWAAAPYTSETATDTLKVISEEEELHYTFRQRGKHRLRLKVFNGHEAVFKDYIVWVNAAFEEGIMLLAEDENGEGDLSFLKTLTPEEIEAGVEEKILEHCFSTVNPGIDMKNPIGFIKIPGDDWFGKQPKFIIAMPDKIYFANPSTLELIGTTPIDGEYKGETAKTFIASDYSYCTPFIQTHSGKIIHINKDYYFLFNNSSTFYENAHNYEQLITQYFIASGNAGIHTALFLLNYSTSTLCALDLSLNIPVESKNLLKNEDIVTIFKENNAQYISRLYSISSTKGDNSQMHIRLLKINYDKIDWETGQHEASIQETTKYSYTLASGDKCPAQGTQLVGCSTYGMALWHEGSEIYAWNYLNPEPKFPNKPVIDVKQADNAGTNVEITYMATSQVLATRTNPGNIDKWLYVGVYDKDTKRGSLYIYDCTKIGQPGLKPYKQFDNQTDRIKFITDKTR